MNKVTFFLFIVSLLFSQTDSESLHLSNGDDSIEIVPGSRIRINGHEAIFLGSNKERGDADLKMLNKNISEKFSFQDIKKINLISSDWILSNIKEKSYNGFKKGLSVSKLLSLVSVYFLYDRENNDQVEITDTETKYISTLIFLPACGALIGGIIGMVKPKPIYDDAIFLKKSEWTIRI